MDIEKINPNHDEISARELLLYLGYDLRKGTDIDRLARNADWVDIRRAKSENSKINAPGLKIGIITTIITTLVTALSTWMIENIK